MPLGIFHYAPAIGRETVVMKVIGLFIASISFKSLEVSRVLALDSSDVFSYSYCILDCHHYRDVLLL